MPSKNPLQGEVWVLDFNPVSGSEQGGRRPALIISHNRFNGAVNELCVVVPLTTRTGTVTKAALPTEVVIEPPEGGVIEPSLILTNHVRTMSHNRLEDRLGQVTTATLDEVLDRIDRILSRPPQRRHN